jgi:hypothetical protein
MVIASPCPPGAVALARRAVTACTARAVSRLAVAHWWTGGDEVSGWSTGGEGGGTRQEEKWCGSPRRSGVGEVAGRGRRDGILMAEDGS